MAINRTSITAQDITQNYSFAIKLLTTRPDTNAIQNPTVEPNIMAGFYDSTRNVVELYVTDQTGRRYLKVL